MLVTTVPPRTTEGKSRLLFWDRVSLSFSQSWQRRHGRMTYGCRTKCWRLLTSQRRKKKKRRRGRRRRREGEEEKEKGRRRGGGGKEEEEEEERALCQPRARQQLSKT